MDQPQCGALVDLSNIQALFDPYAFLNHDSSSTFSDDLEDGNFVHVDAYPLAFLGTVGNIQANGIPPCFYPLLTRINKSVRKPTRSDRPSSIDDDDDSVDGDLERSDLTPSLQAVRAVSAQFYNYITHRVAPRAGNHDSQQGTVTAAISGAFASSEKHKRIASQKRSYCDRGLPSERFHRKISIEDCPVSCRAEFVYTVDIRALKDPSGK